MANGKWVLSERIVLEGSRNKIIDNALRHRAGAGAGAGAGVGLTTESQELREVKRRKSNQLLLLYR